MSTGLVSVIRVRHRGDLAFDAREGGDLYRLHIPVRGVARVTASGELLFINPGSAVMLAPGMDARVETCTDFEQIILAVKRRALHQHWRVLTGHRQSGSPPQFLAVQDLSEGQGARVGQLVRMLADEVDDPAASGAETMLRSAQDLLLTTLLTHLKHAQLELLEGTTDGVSPGFVRRALDFMQSNLHREVSLVDIAETAGVSPRGLQRGFRDHIGEAPMKYLQRVRLERARNDITCAEASASVADIAGRYGFAHKGRFSAAYRAQFGELPSETRKRHVRPMTTSMSSTSSVSAHVIEAGVAMASSA